MKKQQARLKTGLMDPQALVEVLKTHPLMQPMQHILEPILQKIMPALLEEQKNMVAKANERLEAIEDQPDEEVQKALEKYRVKLLSYLQGRALELILPEMIPALLLNTAKPVTYTDKQVEMINGFMKGEVSDNVVKAVGSIATSVAQANSETPNSKEIRFLSSQLKDSTSNFSNLIRGSIAKYMDSGKGNISSMLDSEKMRDALTTIFTDELNEQCKLLVDKVDAEESSVEDNSKQVEDSEDKLLEITLCLTDEDSSSYKAITEAAELIASRAHVLTQTGMHQLMTKVHLDVHQALEQDAPDCFEAKSPRSARNRYFSRWTKVEDVTEEVFMQGKTL